MTAETDKRTSVLATLTATVMAEKKAAAKLTPVEGERPVTPVLPPTNAPFPNDMPQEVVAQKVGELTRIIGHLTEARDALAALTATPVGEVVDLDAERKAREKEADARAAEPDFNAAYKAQQVEAQAAAFSGWVCPDHHQVTVKQSRKTGRDYNGCPVCNKFEG